MKRRDFIKNTGLLMAAAPFMNFGQARTGTEKMLVLGFDGMDPHIVNTMLKRGELPAMRKLANSGRLNGMLSTWPPESPCAWSSFSTGTDPGEHGIFGFVNKKPGTYQPDQPITSTSDPEKIVKLGKWRIPLDSGDIRLNRKVSPFWDTLQDRGVFSSIIKMPANYPPSEMKYGRAISGLGTPDLYGSQGKFTIYTTDEWELNNESAGKGYYAPIYMDEYHTFSGEVFGPENTLVRDPEAVNIPFTAYVDRRHRTIRIDIQGQKILLKRGDTSRWISLKFRLIPNLSSIRGMVRFTLLDLDDQKVRLYIYPLSIDPTDPAQPVASPEDYSRELAGKVGRFHTLGLPADFNGIKTNTLDLEHYIEQNDNMFRESKAMYRYELGHFLEQKRAFHYQYFSSIDQGSHIYYNLRDPQHPGYNPEESRKYGDQIEKMYREYDQLVGETLREIPRDMPLIILSDHGFAPLHRKIDINTLLYREGFLAFDREPYDTDFAVTTAANYSRTRAFAMGLNGIYLNVWNREPEGIVPPDRKRKVMEEIRTLLMSLKDPKNGEKPIRDVYFAEDIYSSAQLALGPDIFVGYKRGYEFDSGSALGNVGREVFTDNTDRWSGDHLIDPHQVPAMLLTSFKYRTDRLIHIWDLAPTILKMYGMEDVKFKGKSII